MAVGVVAAGVQDLCALPLLLLPDSLGLKLLLSWLGGQDYRHCLCCYPKSASFLCSSPPTFRCMDIWNTPASQYAGQRHLCWAVVVLLVVDWRHETKAVSVSLCHYTDVTFWFSILTSKPCLGLPWWSNGWESACQCRGRGFEPWSGKIPHAAEQLGPWATTTEPARLEPVLLNKRGRDSERPVHRDEEWPPLAATRESPHTEMKTQHSHK